MLNNSLFILFFFRFPGKGQVEMKSSFSKMKMYVKIIDLVYYKNNHFPLSLFQHVLFFAQLIKIFLV